MIIMCEGLDGAGKTTTLRALEDIIDTPIVVLKASGSDTLLGKLAHRFGKRSLFYLENIWTMLSKARPVSRVGIVFLDRYCWTPATYGEKKGSLYALCPPPDKTAYFTVEPEERVRRLERSRYNRYHAYLLEHPAEILVREERYQRLYDALTVPKIRIDTTSISPEAAALRLWKLCSDAR